VRRMAKCASPIDRLGKLRVCVTRLCPVEPILPT
jgi:hypothetical protein